MANAIKSKIVPGKDLGNPKKIAALPEGENKLMMGTVFGVIDRMVQRTMPTGQIFEGFGGQFEAVPADKDLPTINSGVLYLPGGFFELLAVPFKEASGAAEKNGTAAPTMRFAFEVSAVKANNPAGYSWEYTPLTEPNTIDPLSEMRDAIASGDGLAQLEDRREAGSAKVRAGGSKAKDRVRKR